MADRLIAPRIPRGFKDSFAEEVVARKQMIDTICEVYRLFGFEPLETPAVEYVEALGKFLPESATPDGGIFSFRDSDHQWAALRYDLTAPLSRVFAQHQDSLPLPYRRYQYGPVFRNEKTDVGRFRQFYQCDFDTVGSSSMAADAEVALVLLAAFQRLGLPQNVISLKVNHRKILDAVLERAGVFVVAGNETPEDVEKRRLTVLRAMDKFDRLGLTGVSDLLGVGRTDMSGDATEGAGLSKGQASVILDFISIPALTRTETIAAMSEVIGTSSPVGREGLEDLKQIAQLLDEANVGPEVVFDPSVIRGLAYYTGPVFEAVLTFQVPDEESGSKAFGSVAGGGRYDDLVMRFTGKRVPATGASIGVDRLLAALNHYGTSAAKAYQGPVIVTIFDRKLMGFYQGVVTELRNAGISSELYLGTESLGKQFKYAELRHAPIALIAGPDEIERNQISIKDLSLGKELGSSDQFKENREKWIRERPGQMTVARADLINTVQNYLRPQP